jgi:hypothetical protein
MTPELIQSIGTHIIMPLVFVAFLWLVFRD